MKILQLNSDGLTDNHILKMLEVKAPGPYFPKLEQLFLMENDVRAAGLEALLKTGMINIMLIVV